MNDFCINAAWIVWFWIVLIFPTKVHDFYVVENKQAKDYLRIGMYTLFAIAAAQVGLYSDSDNSVSSIAFYVVVAISYLQSLYDCYSDRKKWNYIYCCIFTIFILVLVYIRA